MKIALASPPFPKSVNNGPDLVEKLARDAAGEQAAIICFPESFLPGYPGMGYKEEDRVPEKLQAALDKVREIAAEKSIGIILPVDWPHVATGLLAKRLKPESLSDKNFSQ